MRKLNALLVAAAFALVSTTAQAAVFDGGASFLRATIAGLPGFLVDGNLSASGTSTVSLFSVTPDGIGVGGSDGAVFSTSGLTAGPAVFTGTPSITNLFLTAQNGPGGYNAPFTGPSGFPNNQFDAAGGAGVMGGVSAFAAGSQVIIEALGYLSVPVPLVTVGAGGQTIATVGLLTAKIYVDGAPWVTDSTTVTGIASNVISITSDFAGRINVKGAAFTLEPTVNENNIRQTENGIDTIVMAGTRALASGAAGSVTFVSPVYTDPSGVTQGTPIPAGAFQTLVFVPEPGTMLLLGSAVAGLVLVGRKRMQR